MALIVYATGASFPLSTGYCQLSCANLDTAFSFESGGGLGLNSGHFSTTLVRDLWECSIAAMQNRLDGCPSAVSLLACSRSENPRLPGATVHPLSAVRRVGALAGLRHHIDESGAHIHEAQPASDR